MIISGTEKEVLIAVAEQGKASKSEISRRVGFTIDYVELICNCLIRRGCLVRSKRHYLLTEDVKEVIFSVAIKDHHLSRSEGLREFTAGLADKVADKVVAEIKTKNIKSKRVKRKKTKFYPKEEVNFSKEERDCSTNKPKIQIKTDFDFLVEDESLLLESNIDKVGIKSGKEKLDIGKSINLLKNIQKKI